MTFVRELPWRDLVMKCSAVALLSWQRGVEDQAHQADLVENLLASHPTYERKLRACLSEDTLRILLTRETLLALLRVAVIEQSEGRRLSEADWSDNFIRASLAVNQAIYDELVPAQVTNSAIDLVATELRSALVQIENPHVLLGRTNAFFAFSETDAARVHPDYVALDDELKVLTGVAHLEFAAGAYALLSRTVAARNLDEVMAAPVVFDVDGWLRDVKDKSTIQSWLAASSVPMEAAREQWRQEPSLSYAGAGVLFSKPVVTTDEGLVLVPTPTLLANAMGDGTYFTLFDSFQTKKRLRLSRFYGAFFEDYVASIFERAMGSIQSAMVRREIEYAPGSKSTDVFVIANDDVFMVECVAKRMKLTDSVLRLEASAIKEDLDKGVLEKMRQLQRNAQLFRDGTLFPDVPRFDGQRIFPIIASPKAFPRIYVIAKLLKDAQEGEGLLTETEPIELLTIGEIEQLESNLAAGLNLGDLLFRKNRSTPQRRFMTLNNYLIDEEPETAREGNLAVTRGNAVAKHMIAQMMGWGFPESAGEPSTG